jgi:cobalt-zinc-cadmium efflux system membrane fusion protein
MKLSKISCGLILILCGTMLLAGCKAKGYAPDPGSEAPPPANVVREADPSFVTVEHPEQFPLVTAGSRRFAQQLNVTGVVSIDVSRNIPVVSLASGRVLEVHARLGDHVQKGQLLLRVQSADLALAFSDYRKALADEALAQAQYERAKLLYEKGAVAQKDLEVAQDAAAKAKVDVETALDRLRVLGADLNHPTAVVDITAPASGVITEQNVTAAAGVKTLDNSPNLFTITDLSHVWVLCDVYENELANVHEGEMAEIRLAAYPGRVLSARIANIGPILDSNLRTAKVRLEVENPGILRPGMFVTATFHGKPQGVRAVVPASAVLHLHDREWVYVPAGEKSFRRVEVTAGPLVPPDMQEILSGIRPGDRVVSNALIMQNAAEQ